MPFAEDACRRRASEKGRQSPLGESAGVLLKHMYMKMSFMRVDAAGDHQVRLRRADELADMPI